MAISDLLDTKNNPAVLTTAVPKASSHAKGGKPPAPFPGYNGPSGPVMAKAGKEPPLETSNTKNLRSVMVADPVSSATLCPSVLPSRINKN